MILNFAHINLNCLTNKINLVHSFLTLNHIDLLGLTETWLTSEVSDSFVSIPGYHLIRSDSPSGVRKHGVAVFIKDTIKYEQIVNFSSNVVLVQLPDFNIYVCIVYRPPSYSDLDNLALIEFLESMCGNKEIIILGDLNLPTLTWQNYNVSQGAAPLDSMFYDCFISLGLEQMVRKSTIFPSGNILDLILCSHSFRIGNYDVLAQFPQSPHCPVVCTYVFQDFSVSTNRLHPVESFIWPKGRYELISRSLRDVDWNDELCFLGPCEQYVRFLSILRPLIKRYVPTSNSASITRVPWAINPPRSLRRERTLAWRTYVDSRSANGRHHPSSYEAWCVFSSINREYRKFSIESQKQYELLVASKLSFDPKPFHAYVKHRRIGRSSIGPLRSGTGQLTDDPLDMSELFLEAFTSVFTVDLPMNCQPHQTCASVIETLHITPEHVFKVLCGLDPGSSMGSDAMHPRLLRSLASELSLPLAIIFNSSLNTGILPVEWRSSMVVPIFKKSSRYDPLNYRPISLTSVVCKSLERIIVSHLMDYLDSNQLLSSEQFGFRKAYSTCDQLLATYNYITSQVDDGKIVDLIFFDYSKAFDVVCHVILLQKLLELGIDGNILNWISSFLTNRTMQVKVANSFSRSARVTSGVPQGSVLGPILFLIYINHVVSGLNCYYKIFADDIKLYLGFTPSSCTSSQYEFQHCINKLVSTSRSWGLSMSPHKCVAIRFSPKSCSEPFTGPSPYLINDRPIEFVEAHADLGVVVDRSLKFHAHVKKAVAIAGGLTTNILSSTLCRDASFLMNIYTSHVRPKLEYGSSLWNVRYIGDLQLLERVQRRWTRAVEGLSDLSYNDRLRRLDLFSFQGRLLRADLVLVWKIIHGHCGINPETLFTFLSDTATRGHPYKLYVQRANLEIRRRFFSLRVVTAWNSLTAETVCAESLDTFKRLLHRDLGEQLFEFS